MDGVRVHWPLGYSGPESPRRQEGFPDPAAWAHRSTPMPANASCAVGQETLGNTVRMLLARPRHRRQESPCSRTHAPPGLGCRAGGWSGHHASGGTQLLCGVLASSGGRPTQWDPQSRQVSAPTRPPQPFPSPLTPGRTKKRGVKIPLIAKHARHQALGQAPSMRFWLHSPKASIIRHSNIYWAPAMC